MHRTTLSTRLPLRFGYGAGGQRITKVVGDPDHPTEPTGFREHYIRDAQGNVMATYRFEKLPVTEPDPGFEASLKLTARPIYGSSRLGVDAHALELGGLSFEDPNPYLLDNPIGKVNYELTDHLGNVTTVITDELLGVDIDDNGSTPEYFQPFVVSAQGYEPFGSLLPGRHYRGVLGTDPDAMVVDEDFEGAEVVGNVVNGWNANAVAVLSMDNSSTRRLLVSDAIQYDGAQLNFATIAGESYTLTFDLDLGTTARVGVAIYAENPYGGIPPGPTWTVGGTKTVTFTATTALTRIKIYKVSNTPTTYYFIDNVTIQGPQLLLGNYRFGFQGQEKDDEIYGATGTSYTAEFWQYDPRTTQRWNIDPVVKPWESPYATFGRNPIRLIDPNGANATKYEDEAGNALVPETKDGNDATVTIPDGNREAFLREYNSTDNPDGMMTNESWIRRYGSHMSAVEGQNVPSWSIDAINKNSGPSVGPSGMPGADPRLGYDPTSLLKAGIGAEISIGAYTMYNKESWFSLRQMKSYSHRFNGNQHTGGKLAHGRFWNKTLTGVGYGLGAYNFYGINQDHSAGLISDGQMVMEQIANAASTFGGLHGAAVGIGWEAGRLITNIPGYDENFRTPVRKFFNIKP